MADEQGHPNPGSFGVEAAVKKLRDHLDQLLGHQHRETHAAWCRLEGQLKQMATREEFDALKAAFVTAIADATTRVTTDIQALRDQLATGVAVTDQDLADFQKDIGDIANIDKAAVPVPDPVVDPASRRK